MIIRFALAFSLLAAAPLAAQTPQAAPAPLGDFVKVALDTDKGRIVWHDGGNGWSLGIMARFPDQDAMVFWVSNHAYKDGEWNLENLERKLTLGIAKRVLDDG